MKFSFLRLPFLSPRPSGRAPLAVSERTFIVAGLAGLAMWLAIVVVADGYLLYLAFIREDAPSEAYQAGPQFSERELDDVIQLLDERDKTFTHIVGTTSVPLEGIEPPSTP